MDFTAIDFETANGKRASVCAVGMTKVRDGEIVAQTSWLIKPPHGFDHFDTRNIAIHGITKADVADAATWVESAARIRNFIGDDFVVAHYAPFDKSVWNQASEWSGVDFGDFNWFCSRDLAKAHLSLPDCSLPQVADALGITGLEHHNAQSDSLICAQVVLAIAERAGVSSWVDLQTVTPSKSALSKSGRAYAAGTSIKKNDLPEPNMEADPTHELFGQGLTITGGFELLSRMQAFELAASFGANVQLGTTLKTSILVICSENPHAPGFALDHGSTKAKKAYKYITERGQQIRLMSESEFYVAVGMAPNSIIQLQHVEEEKSTARENVEVLGTSVNTKDRSPKTIAYDNPTGSYPISTQSSPEQFNNEESDGSLTSHEFIGTSDLRENTKAVITEEGMTPPTAITRRFRRISLSVLAWFLVLATAFSLLCTAAGYSFDAVAGTTFLIFSALLGLGSYFAFRAAKRK